MGRTVTFPLCLKKIHYIKLLCPQLKIPPFGSVVKVVIGLTVSTFAPRVFLSAWVSVKRNCNNLIHFKYLRPEAFFSRNKLEQGQEMTKELASCAMLRTTPVWYIPQVNRLTTCQDDDHDQKVLLLQSACPDPGGRDDLTCVISY